MADITAELDLEISKFKSAIRDADRRIARFSSKAGKQGKDAGSGIVGGMGAAFKGLGPLLAGGLAAIGGIAIGRKIGSEISAGVSAAAKMETLEIGFEVLTGSPEQAKKTLGELRELGASTPLEFFDLASAARSLIAFGEDAEVVPETLRKIGDVASGVGAPIGDIAELYGKARVQGTLFAEDINQLTGRGINVIKEFAGQLGVSEGEVKKLASQGKITFPMLEQAFGDLTSSGGAFSDMMARQSQTLEGRFSTFKDQITELRLEFGAPIADVLKPILEKGIGLVKSFKEEAAAVGSAVARGVDLVFASFQAITGRELVELTGAGLSLGFKGAVNVLWKSLVATWTSTGRMINAIFSGAVSFLEVATTREFWSGLGDALLSAAYGLQAVLLRAGADLLKGFEKIPGIENISGGLEDAASLAEEKARESGGSAGDLLAPAREKAAGILEDVIREALSGFTEGFENGRDVFDTSGEMARFTEAAARISAAADKLAAAREEAKAKADKEDAAGGPAAGAVASLSSMPRSVGALQSSINLLTGSGNMFDPVVAAAQAGVKEQQTTNGILERILRGGPNETPPPPAPRRRPVFATM